MRPLPAAAALLFAAAALSGTAAACGTRAPTGSGRPDPTVTTPLVTPSVSSTTTPPPSTAPPATAFRPATTAPSPDDAAYQMISAWGAGSRAQAARIASPGAVGSLFTVAYPGSALQFRGCSSGFSPADCDYRDGDALIKIYASREAGGWYVSSVTVEN
jgi:hypothetical protein